MGYLGFTLGTPQWANMPRILIAHPRQTCLGNAGTQVLAGMRYSPLFCGHLHGASSIARQSKWCSGFMCDMSVALSPEKVLCLREACHHSTLLLALHALLQGLLFLPHKPKKNMTRSSCYLGLGHMGLRNGLELWSSGSPHGTLR